MGRISSRLFVAFPSAFPIIEQEAIALAKGAILDLGCGAGHSLVLQNMGHDVTAIDQSLELSRSLVIEAYNEYTVKEF